MAPSKIYGKNYGGGHCLKKAELKHNSSAEEMSYLLEVVYSLEEEIGLDKQEVESIRLEKKEKRWRFCKRNRPFEGQGLN